MLEHAVNSGVLQLNHKQINTFFHMVKILIQLLATKETLSTFILTTTFLMISGYLVQYKTILNG